MTTSVKSYIPRHVRIGCCVEELPDIVVTHDVCEVIPILDDEGNLVKSYSHRVSLSAIENNAKYNLEDFKLRSLIEQGVKLDIVNLIPSNGQFLDRLSSIVNKANDALDIVDRLEKLQDEKEGLLGQLSLSPDDKSNKSEHVEPVN